MNTLAYTIHDAASALGISESSIRTAIRNGELPTKRLGRRTLIRHEDLKNWLDALPETEQP